MAKLSQSVLVGASLAPVWDYYFEATGWPAWVDGFQAVESADGYPEDGRDAGLALDPGRPRDGDRAGARPRAADACTGSRSPTRSRAAS